MVTNAWDNPFIEKKIILDPQLFYHKFVHNLVRQPSEYEIQAKATWKEESRALRIHQECATYALKLRFSSTS